jgi:DNA-binding CsgD family transcriptional regulator
MGDLGEIVLDSTSRTEFRRATLSTIMRSLSMDGAVLNHTWSGAHIHVNASGLDQRELRPSLSDYLDEMTSEELSGLWRRRFFRHDTLFAPRRRESLRRYAEYLRPQGTWGFAARGRLTRRGLFWLTVTREGRRAQYRDAELGILDDVFPLVMAGETMYAPDVADAPEPAGSSASRKPCRLAALVSSRSRAWRAWRTTTTVGVTNAHHESAPYCAEDELEARLPPRARETLALLLEGLSDKLIAARLGISQYTVNHYTKMIYRRFAVGSRSALLSRWLCQR